MRGVVRDLFDCFMLAIILVTNGRFFILHGMFEKVSVSIGLAAVFYLALLAIKRA